MAIAEKLGPVPGLTREAYLGQLAAGETQASILRAWNVNGHTMKNWIQKWDLKGVNAERARELLAEMVASVEEVTIQPGGGASDTPQYIYTALQLQEQKLLDYEQEIARLTQMDREHTNRIVELTKDRDKWEKIAEQCDQAISELMEERTTLLATIEKATPKTDPNSTYQALIECGVFQPIQMSQHDNVNHPAHYTAGGVECIDAIEAAVFGLPGPQAYATGAAIKYLWRYSRKNGLEDLRKARWYLDRLIGEVERVSS